MRTVFASLTFAIVFNTAVAGQDRVKAEIGTALGLPVAFGNGGSLVSAGVPGGGVLGTPSMYATIFATPAVTLEPQLGFTLLSGDGETIMATKLITQVGFLFTPGARGSGYFAPNLGFMVASGNGTATSWAPGAALGYWAPVGNSIGLRIEGVYRRWFGGLISDVNDVSLRLAVGALLK